LSSPDQLDQVVRVISAREWLLLLAMVLLVTSAIVWGFEGRLSTRTEGFGVATRGGSAGAEQDLEIAVFVPALQAQELKPGMPVEIVPAFMRGGRYGFMRGTVRTVAEYPATESALLAELQNSRLAPAIAADGPVNEVRVKLIRDHRTTSGYQWSTKNGAPLKIAPAMPCMARIIVREDAPLTLATPAVKGWVEAL
jgi:HlyD family secretion protein